MNSISTYFKSLAKEIRTTYPKLKQSETLEALSKLHGFRDWNTACKSTQLPSDLTLNLKLAFQPSDTEQVKIGSFVVDPVAINLTNLLQQKADFKQLPSPNHVGGMSDQQIVEARKRLSRENDPNTVLQLVAMDLMMRKIAATPASYDTPKATIVEIPDSLRDESVAFYLESVARNAARTRNMQKRITLSDDNWELLDNRHTADGVMSEYQTRGHEIVPSKAQEIAHDRFMDDAYLRSKS